MRERGRECTRDEKHRARNCKREWDIYEFAQNMYTYEACVLGLNTFYNVSLDEATHTQYRRRKKKHRK